MKKDKHKKTIKYDKKTIKFLIIISLIGIITGSLLITVLNKADKELVTDYISHFVEDIHNNTFNYYDSLKNSLIINTVIIISIWLLGISIIGIPLIILLIFLKSMTLGFTIASFIFVYKLKGLLLGLIYIFPSSVINLLLFILVGSFSVRICLKTIRTIINKKDINYKNIINRYVSVLIFSLVIIVISSLFEIFVTSFLIKLFASIIIK
jgi:stage II sporulation protein M